MRTRRSQMTGALAVLWLTVTSSLYAQQGGRVTVEETGGIRRTQYPTRLMLELPAGRLESTESIRLVADDISVPVQGTAIDRWGDRSIRTLEVDFNVSIQPFERRVFELLYGPDVIAESPTRRGLVVTEDTETVQAGNIRFNKRGWPLLLSVGYRGEVITDGRNGLALVDDTGMRHDSSTIEWESVELLKRGPLVVLLRYEGTVRLSDGGRAAVLLDVEMPNSKSWVRISASIGDPDGRVREVAIEMPVGLGEYPWVWDFGTENGTYGAFRDENGSVIFEQIVTGSDSGSWSIVAGPAGDERSYEESPAGRRSVARLWTHLQNQVEAVAFAIQGADEVPGTFTAALNGVGQTSFGFAPDTPVGEHVLTVYAHFVSTPVPIGAATSPASILSPLRARVEPLADGF